MQNSTQLALLVALLWGAGYTCLSPVSGKVSKYLINIVYGCGMILVNSLCYYLYGNWNDVYELAKVGTGSCLFAYVGMSIAGGIVYLTGSALATKENAASQFIGITSMYTIFRFLFGYVCLHERPSNMPLTILGLLCGILCVVLLSYAK